MIRLARYVKPFWLLVLMSIVLLFVQGMAELSLPDYIGQIVNTGIQQGGIENAVPQAVRQSEMNRLTLFMSAQEQQQVLAAYTLVTSSSPDYQAQQATYPALVREPVYVLQTVTQADRDRLDPILGRAWITVSRIERVIADPSLAARLGTSTAFDLSSLPPGTDVFAELQQLPTQQRLAMMNAISQRFGVMGNRGIIQAATPAIRAEYAALGVDTEALQHRYIFRVGGIMLGLSLVSGISAITVGLLASQAAAGAARDLRRAVFQKVATFSNHEFDTFSVASLITRTTNDVTQLQTLSVMLIRMVCYAPILGIGGIIKATQTNASMWWILAIGLGALIVLIAVIFNVALPKFKLIQTLVDRLNLVTREHLAGMMVVRAFNTQPFEEQRFDQANSDLTRINLSVTRIMVMMMPMMMLIMNGLTLLIVWVGAHQVAAASMQVGDMIAFMQYALQVVFAFMMLSFMFIMIPRAAVSGDRVADVLATEVVIRDPAHPRRFAEPFDATIEFHQVSFRYPGAEEDALHKLSFTARPGQTTAIIGSTGSGKSTLVNLIPRFYDVTDGAILIDGVDIRDVTQHELRAKLGYIPQRANLFSGTIESNLRYADAAATPDMLNQAIAIAQASEFIADKPDGLASEIAQGGGNVSGGQRQRLSISRALVKQAPIYIFDDSFSALDFKTDAALRRALKQHTGASTLLIVTQRVSTVMNAEQIIVLDQGKIVGIGTHQHLLHSCEVYREIAVSQLGIEEFAA